MHFLIALVVLFAMFFWTGDNGNYLPRPPFRRPTRSSRSTAWSAGASPAQEAGFHIGDRIVAVDGQRFAVLDRARAPTSMPTPGRRSTSR